MNRRMFLGGLVAGAAGLLVPVPPRIVVPERRYWALDRTMVGPALMDLSWETIERLERMLEEAKRLREARRTWTQTLGTSLRFVYDADGGGWA